MSWKLPLKHTQTNPKWVTIALLGLYAFVAIFIIVQA